MEELYSLDSNGNFTELYLLLGCQEKIEYFIARQHLGMDCWALFCEDINILYYKQNNFFCAWNLYNKNPFFRTTSKKIHFPTEQGYIEYALKKNHIIGLKTRFDLIDEYIWSSENKPHTGHIVGIVGKNNTHFFIVDSSEILNLPICQYKTSSKEIIQIPIEHMQKALNELCIVYEYTFLLDKVSSGINLYKILKKIYSRYILSPRAFTHIYQTYRGVAAYKEMVTDLKQRNGLWEQPFESHWYAHIISARRKILLHTLLPYTNLCKNVHLYDCLNNSIQLWETLKLLIMKNNISPIPNFFEKIINIFEKIYIQDWYLFQAIEDWILSNKSFSTSILTI